MGVRDSFLAKNFRHFFLSTTDISTVLISESKQTKISGTCFFGSIMLSLKTLTPHPMAPPPRKGNQQIATLVSLLKFLLNP